LCPNGTQRAFNGCLWPVDSQGNYGCLNPATNRPVGVSGFANVMDGRVYNLTLRRPNGTMPTVLGLSGSRVIPRPMFNSAFFRIHQRNPLDSGVGAGCLGYEADELIDCLVKASPCSIGLGIVKPDAGMKLLSLKAPLTAGAAVAPTRGNIERVLETCTAGN